MLQNMNNLRSEADITKWRNDWVAASKRKFNPGEILGVLRDAINKYLSANGAADIVPTKGGGVKAILDLIPDEHYEGLVTYLGTMEQQSNNDIVLGAQTPNKKRTDDNRTPTAEANSPKRIKFTALPEDQRQSTNTKRKGEKTETTDSSKNNKVPKVFAVAEATEVTNRGSTRTRNLPFILKFPAEVRHYADIFASEGNSFCSDETATKFVEAAKKVYPYTLSTLLGNASYKLQCVIFTNDVGYAAAAFVIRDFKPATVLLYLRNPNPNPYVNPNPNPNLP